MGNISCSATSLYDGNSSQISSLIVSRAKRIPTQFLGPEPNPFEHIFDGIKLLLVYIYIEMFVMQIIQTYHKQSIHNSLLPGRPWDGNSSPGNVLVEIPSVVAK